MSKQSQKPTDFVSDILGEIEKIENFSSKTKTQAEFEEDEKTFYACVRSLEIIGEASKRISQHFRQKFPSVPWQDMAAMRDKLIHDYGGIDANVVWKTMNEDLPELKRQLEEIVSNI